MATSKYTIATFGSHSSLQILKGAKDEGFKTLVITIPSRESFYQRFPFIDKIEIIPTWPDFPKIEKKLAKENVIIIPHGSIVAYLGLEKNKAMKLFYFGNKAILDWEADRANQRKWLQKAKRNVNAVLPYLNDDARNVLELLFPFQLKICQLAFWSSSLKARRKPSW